MQSLSYIATCSFFFQSFSYGWWSRPDRLLCWCWVGELASWVLQDVLSALNPGIKPDPVWGPWILTLGSIFCRNAESLCAGSALRASFHSLDEANHGPLGCLPFDSDKRKAVIRLGLCTANLLLMFRSVCLPTIHSSYSQVLCPGRPNKEQRNLFSALCSQAKRKSLSLAVHCQEEMGYF